jgi:hypothetical protein
VCLEETLFRTEWLCGFFAIFLSRGTCVRLDSTGERIYITCISARTVCHDLELHLWWKLLHLARPKCLSSGSIAKSCQMSMLEICEVLALGMGVRSGMGVWIVCLIL